MPEGDSKPIEVPRELITFGRFIDRTSRMWLAAGRLESRLFADELDDIEIDRPIFVTGLARSGSTLVLELLNASGLLASQQYRDFPPVYTPIWWNWFLDHVPRKEVEPAERSHQDGILVTPDSPEAIDEVIWMRFFPNFHDPAASSHLTGETSNPEFEAFYKAHVKKLLMVRRRDRYLCKGNYNVSRLTYLQKLFPDAKFILPIREPVMHIASLMKQHRLFVREESRDPRVLEHMTRIGHFEFGLNRTPINVDDGSAREVADLWDAGHEVRGWALYWKIIYEHIWNTIEADDSLKSSSLIVRFEDLCRNPRDIIGQIFAHCELEIPEALLSELSTRPRMPDYYDPGLDPGEIADIHEITAPTRALYRYDDAARP